MIEIQFLIKFFISEKDFWLLQIFILNAYTWLEINVNLILCHILLVCVCELTLETKAFSFCERLLT